MKTICDNSSVIIGQSDPKISSDIKVSADVVQWEAMSVTTDRTLVYKQLSDVWLVLGKINRLSDVVIEE